MNIAVRKPLLGSALSGFLGQNRKILIDGKWVQAQNGQTFEVEDPATQEIIAHVPLGDKADIDLAVAAARRAFDSGPWSRMSPGERSRIVWKLGDLLEKYADEFAELEALDNGKPVTNARKGDVQGSIEMFRYMAGWATRLNGETIQVSSPGNWHAYTLREPVGVVGQIIPWNFPLMMAAWKLAPALASGCTIVLKPAEQTPLSALRFGELIQEAGIPDGVVNIVTGFGETAGAALAAHPDVDKVAFTGSTEVGKIIVRAAAGNLKRVSLELGGKSPAIVFPDADLDLAIAGTADAIFYNQGQCCTAGSRLFAHKSVYDKVVAGVAAAAGKLKIGHGLDPTVNLGPLVSKEQHDRVKGFLDSGRKEGAEVVTGGKIAGNQGYFVEPTVLAKTNRDMRVVREEIFGPVVCVQSFDDDSLEAVAKFANDTEYGLQASVWTRNLKTAHMMARKIKAGTICINTHNYGDPAWPFGGYKQSGWGREMGKEVMEHYTETKSVAARL
ncbi:aldehyde dehydrogenase family protein [Aestuariivirga sp. YIM B02566]|uniref:Aldehyde dehydrogenase family protein n=1 Tax=Taklimakanibacter albus TaxID=2800327 RepID=A0ACC5RD37_9HYPH|nr:aldehyde dehydrogenase family protein [Aestuariivirga sp. YIM B02566]MBK1870308.1 aldehyde dehydrogenase family protein [Aestuariivirga sp. YIM B02566]